MRILFVINNFSYGGAEKLVFDLARSLSPVCEFIGVAALYRMNNDTEVRIRQSLEQAGVKTYILDKAAGRDRFKTVWKICEIVKEDKIQLIHGHCSVPMLLSKLAGRMTRTKVVCTIHSIRGYKAIQEKFTAWMTDCYVSIGCAAEEYMLRDLKIKKKKIKRIYNSVDTNRFIPKERKVGFWGDFGFDINIPVVINVGRVVPVKNQICILRAITQCCRCGKPIQCAILGGFDENSETYRTLHQYIQENSLEKYVRFLGQQDNVADFLQNSDCFVMTSIYEGLSVAYLEAVLCGLPIVTTDLPFVKELQQFGTSALIVPQDDADALADVLLCKSYASPSEETVLHFRKNFSLVKFTEAHLQLYNQIIGGK